MRNYFTDHVQKREIIVFLNQTVVNRFLLFIKHTHAHPEDVCVNV